MPVIRALAALWLLLSLAMLSGGSARAQEDTLFDALLLDRLGFLVTPCSGARSLALGGSGTAWTEDLQSLTINPAGLASITRIETQLGFRRLSNSQNVTYFGNSREHAPASTGLDALGLAYPFPSYRGNFVFAIGVFRRHDAVMEMFWEGLNAYDDDYEIYSLQLDGGLLGLAGGFGVSLGPRTDAGMSIEYLHGGIDLFSRFDVYFPAGSNTPLYRDLIEDEYILRGWRAHLGLQSQATDKLRIGIRISTPTLLSIDGESRWREFDQDEGELVLGNSGLFYFEEDLRLPYQIAVGFAPSFGLISLAADFEYVDWNQTRLNGRRLTDLELRPALQQTLNQHYGLQLSSANWPWRLYLGYSRLQEPLLFLESGEFDGSGYALLKSLELVETTQSMSAGCGFFLSENLLLEGGYSFEWGERQTQAGSAGIVDFKQRTERSRALITFSYRL